MSYESPVRSHLTDVARRGASTSEQALGAPFLLCDGDGIILSASCGLAAKFGYSTHELRGQSIALFMSSALAHEHQCFFFPQCRACPLRILDVGHAMRPVTLWGRSRRFSGHVAVAPQPQGRYSVEFWKLYEILGNELARHCGGAEWANRLGVFEGSAPKITHASLAALDVACSTEFLALAGPLAAMEQQRRFQKTATRIVARNFYPFVAVHETVGDMMILVAGGLQGNPAPWMLACAAQIQEAVEEFCVLRIAAAAGEVAVVHLDGQVRIFGLPMTTACRMQGLAALSGTGTLQRICVCERFMELLRHSDNEAPVFAKGAAWSEMLQTQSEHHVLKGLPEPVECFMLELVAPAGFSEAAPGVPAEEREAFLHVAACSRRPGETALSAKPTFPMPACSPRK